MTKVFTRPVLVVIVLGVATIAIVLTFVSSSSSAARQASAGDDAVARVGDRVISLNDVDERWRHTSPAEQAQALQTVYDGRKAALEALVGDMLIDAAAKRTGVSPQELAKSGITRRLSPISDDDVVAFYASNREQLEGRSFEELQPLIRRLLETRERSRARRALVQELGATGPRVRVMLDAPRQPVSAEADDPSMGAPGAPVTLVVFSDFQCPFCARVEPTLKQVRETYGTRVRLVWKDFPLTSIHPQAFKAAEAGHCAAEQGKYWEYHDRLFANQQALAQDALAKYASDLGLDATTFTACLESSKHHARVQQGLDAGARLGVQSTPTIFVNGRAINGAQPYEAIAAIVDEELDRGRF